MGMIINFATQDYSILSH